MSKPFLRWLSIREGIAVSVICGLFAVGLPALKAIFPEWFSPVLWGMVGFTFAAIIVSAFVLWTRLPKPEEPITPENVEANIRAWLETFRLSVQSVDDPKTLFTIIVTLMSDSKLVIGHPKAFNRYIVVQASILISPDDKAMLDDRLSPEEKGLFSMRLGSLLSRSAIGYTADMVQGAITLVRRVPITASLNEGNFMEAFDTVDAAKQGVLQNLNLMLVEERKKHPSKPSKPDRRR